MKAKKIPIQILIVLLLFALLSTSALAAEEPVLVNGEMKNAANGIPEGWGVLSYLQSDFQVETGDGIVTLLSTAMNDLRLRQTVEVEEYTSYVLSAEIFTHGVTGGRGATLSIDNYSIDGTCLYSSSFYADNDWTPIELAFQTTGGQKAVQIALRLGGYSEDSQGLARFRNVQLRLADENTQNIQVLGDWTMLSQNNNTADNTEDSEARRIFLRSVFSIMIGVTVLFAVVMIFGFYRNRNIIGNRALTGKRTVQYFVLLVLAGFVIRSVLCSAWGGHDTDMGCWKGWGSYIANYGTRDFYTAPGHEWYDYPPAYMLVLGFLSKILTAFNIAADSAAGNFLFMVPAFTADILSALLLMDFADEHGWSRSWQLILAGFVILNPAVFFLSGAWGQIDSILTLFLLLSFRFLLRGQRIGAGAFFGLAITFKWQALIYGPVLAAGYLLTLRRNRDILHTVLGVLAAFAVIFLVGLPFQGDQGPLWMINRFLNAAGGYDYASVEAYNFMALCGGNWARADQQFLLGITYKQFGTVAIVLFVAAALWLQFVTARRSLLKNRPPMENAGVLFLAAALCMFGIFTFGHYMHERYVFPVLLLLLFAFVYYRDSRLLLCVMILSVVLFLNEMSAMYVVSNIAMDVVRSGREHVETMRLCAFAEVLSCLYFVWVVFTMDIHGEEGRA